MVQWVGLRCVVVVFPAHTHLLFKVKQNENVIIQDQSNYMNNINRPILDPRRKAHKVNILNSKEQSLYRLIVRKINWAVQGSRPDLAFEMIAASTKLKI